MVLVIKLAETLPQNSVKLLELPAGVKISSASSCEAIASPMFCTAASVARPLPCPLYSSAGFLARRCLRRADAGRLGTGG